MLGTKERISDEELAAQARELANLLNRLPLPPLPTTAQLRPIGDPSHGPGRAPGT